MAGGRGAFVLGCVFTLYFALKHITFSKLISYILIGLAVLLTINAILSDNEIFKMGFERIFNFLVIQKLLEQITGGFVGI